MNNKKITTTPDRNPPPKRVIYGNIASPKTVCQPFNSRKDASLEHPKRIAEPASTNIEYAIRKGFNVMPLN
jgi:hypothetical protein